MSKHDYIHISGYITVIVDAVDLEQIEISQPGLAHEPAAPTKAFAAAQEKDGFKSLQRVLMQSGFTLEPDEYRQMTGGKFEVIFITRQMLRDSEVAA